MSLQFASPTAPAPALPIARGRSATPSSFKRRDELPLSEGLLWHIDTGYVRLMQDLLQIRNGPVQQRLELLLEWLVKHFGKKTRSGVSLIEPRLTHQDIAELVGTTRVTVTRVLHQFEQDGKLHRTGRHGAMLVLS
ncbi:Crp/Fnr family transcriptional regulator [Nodosilinea sp. P-1105]|uniref:Crp/Fnr family transcriptional regulator n=1 Tax=Nodosilinea sp. P-1105 TaxID=2546229 RepID=UPI00146E1314|nr:Crp/Fnr family transcriptional regulator [Nodosilinea sp. P-1105]NMF85842.1 Crp/Fnr family transcriptional regulator [Nodosilinea sp. P-1105]